MPPDGATSSAQGDVLLRDVVGAGVETAVCQTDCILTNGVESAILSSDSKHRTQGATVNNQDQPVLSTDHQPVVWVVELDNREDNDTTGLVGVYATREAAERGVVDQAKADFGLDQTELHKEDGESDFEVRDEPADALETGVFGSLFWTAYRTTVVE